MNKIRVFISYTLAGGDVTLAFLNEFKDKLKNLVSIDSYIDIIDNDSSGEEYQTRVMYEVDNSNYLFLIQSDEVTRSGWVRKELDRAKEKNIPVIEIHIDSINNFIRTLSLVSLLRKSISISALKMILRECVSRACEVLREGVMKATQKYHHIGWMRNQLP